MAATHETSSEMPDLGIIRAGFLEKGKSGGSWKERYFVLTRSSLHRFQRVRDKKSGKAEDLFGTPKHTIKVRELTTFEPNQRNHLEIEIKSRDGPHRKEYSMTLRAKTEEDAAAWIESIGIAKKQARSRAPLKRANTISGNYLATPGGGGDLDSSVDSPGGMSPLVWQGKKTSGGGGNPNRVTLISQRVGGVDGVESVLSLFPQTEVTTTLSGVDKKNADILVTLASGARYQIAAKRCTKKNAKVALERFEGPGFASMCDSPPAEVNLRFNGSPRRRKGSGATPRSPGTPRTPPPPKSSSSSSTSGVDHFKWALLVAVPMTFWYTAAKEAQTRYLCAALLALILLIQFIVSRFCCSSKSSSTITSAAPVGPKLFDFDVAVEVIGVGGGGMVGLDTPAGLRSPMATAASRGGSSSLSPIAAEPVMELEQALSETDCATRMAQLLCNGGLEEYEEVDPDDEDEMGTEESMRFNPEEEEIAQRVLKAIMEDYQSTYDKLKPDDRAGATKPETWPNSKQTRHPSSLVLDSTLLVGFIRGYAVNVKKSAALDLEKSYVETIEALVKSLSWRYDMRTSTVLEEDLPFVDETFAMWPNLMYGKDSFGHTIMAERITSVQTAEITAYYNEADHENKSGKFYEILRVRAQILEAIARKKREISIEKGFRTHKMLLIVDMGGLTGGRIKKMIAARAAVQMIFSLGSDNYPETMRRIYIVNAPFFFNMLYSVAKTMMDPVTVDKVKMVKNGDALIAEMKADNIEEDQMPDWLGGRASHPGISMQEVARKYVVEFQKSTAAAAAPAAAPLAAAAVDVVADSGAAEKSNAK